MAREINLVPDIKNEMIKTLKLRNLIFFICIVVASASITVTLIFGVIVGGQQLAINSKTDVLKTYSEKLNSYSDLNEFLTIKDQVGNIASITQDKRVASRTFNILSALIPTGPDTIQISELSINLADETPTFTFDAQANAGKAPYIDYNVLDSFKKSMQYMRYDYGNYVDKDNNLIPAYCMIEKNADGAYLSDQTKGLYAYWTVFADGCNNFSAEELKDFLDESEPEEDNNAENNLEAEEPKTTIAGYNLEDYNGTQVVKIWRTPQYDDWYASKNLDLDGTIQNIEHFESSCISYFGEEADNEKIKWSSSNETCLLVPDGVDGINITESSNGRDASEQLVLRFAATLALAPEVYDFNNFHMIALAPSERRNVTDSYVQLQAIFVQRAKDCQEGDTACKGGN